MIWYIDMLLQGKARSCHGGKPTWIPHLCYCILCVLTKSARNHNSGHSRQWEEVVWELLHNPGSAACGLCDLEQITSPLWALFPLLTNRRSQNNSQSSLLSIHIGPALICLPNVYWVSSVCQALFQVFGTQWWIRQMPSLLSGSLHFVAERQINEWTST